MAMESNRSVNKWMRKFFPKASEQDRGELIDLWRRMESVRFPDPDETALSEEELLERTPRAEIRETDMGRIIGKGSYAVVHRVEWNDKSYAMKSFSSKSEALRELAIQSKLSGHPHILPPLAYAEIPRASDAQSDKFSILMELCDGSIDPRGRSIDTLAEFAAADALEIMLQLARALLFIHSQRIMHRDVKPGNVLYRSKDPAQEGFVSGGTMIKLADFGTSRFIREGSYVHTAKRGTKCYWAPEVVQDGPTCPYTDRADVYSFAMTCYAIGTGRTPLERYARLSSRDFYRKVCGWGWILPGKRPKVPRWMDPALARVMKQCWHSTPEERPPMGVVCWALEFLAARASGAARAELSPALYPIVNDRP
ncbi:light-sensor Protein kinase-like [Selaginella moellendorffii]|uniref:light-sensor Protein kinase-like n=1 Tax=Selaginella moellendorffii TaxID=88036 RepID=UPI000D1C55B2|nr:light-sensor Protein kinase-like [Selaginella moellendorffii]|eukprot:XP_024524036.1 light-sensor Protein kinase-like [Selaginella moellendorffii]